MINNFYQVMTVRTRSYVPCFSFGRVVACVTLAGLMAGCAANKAVVPMEQSAGIFDRSLADAASAATASSDKSAAIRQYQKIASDNPTRSEPWARIAQIYFDESQYSLAISAAEEALRRDPTNRQSKSITAVGGLRLAVRSIEDLRQDSTLGTDANADAQRLAALLRETLGLSVLVPASSSPEVKPSPRRPAVSRPSAAPAATVPSTSVPSVGAPAVARPPPAKAARPVEGGGVSRPAGSANPFDSLR